LTAAALHVDAKPEKHPSLLLMLADASEVMKCCKEVLGLYIQFSQVNCQYHSKAIF